MRALAFIGVDKMGRHFHLAGGDTVAKFQFVGDGEIYAKLVPDVMRNRVIAIADNPNNIPPLL